MAIVRSQSLLVWVLQELQIKTWDVREDGEMKGRVTVPLTIQDLHAIHQ